MNKRIEQLAKQNGFIHDHMSVGERNDALNKFEKFAELIVRDCINVIRQEWFNENNTVPDQDARSIAIHLGAKLGIESALHAVTKQFGVE